MEMFQESVLTTIKIYDNHNLNAASSSNQGDAVQAAAWLFTCMGDSIFLVQSKGITLSNLISIHILFELLYMSKETKYYDKTVGLESDENECSIEKCNKAVQV